MVYNLIFSLVLTSSSIHAQWIRIDSIANLSIHKEPSTGMRIGEGVSESSGECNLPLAYESNSKLIYYYYIRNDRSDLVYFQLFNEERNEIVSTGFYRLIYVSKDYSKSLQTAKGNLILCWEKDLVWTYYKEGKIINEFYDAGVLKDLNAIDAFPYPRKKIK